MGDHNQAGEKPIFRDEGEQGDGSPDAGVLPVDVPRGGITVPDANDTGMTTPPISGWGETLEGEEVVADESTDSRSR